MEDSITLTVDDLEELGELTAIMRPPPMEPHSEIRMIAGMAQSVEVSQPGPLMPIWRSRSFTSCRSSAGASAVRAQRGLASLPRGRRAVSASLSLIGGGGRGHPQAWGETGENQRPDGYCIKMIAASTAASNSRTMARPSRSSGVRRRRGLDWGIE